MSDDNKSSIFDTPQKNNTVNTIEVAELVNRDLRNRRIKIIGLLLLGVIVLAASIYGVITWQNKLQEKKIAAIRESRRNTINGVPIHQQPMLIKHLFNPGTDPNVNIERICNVAMYSCPAAIKYVEYNRDGKNKEDYQSVVINDIEFKYNDDNDFQALKQFIRDSYDKIVGKTIPPLDLEYSTIEINRFEKHDNQEDLPEWLQESIENQKKQEQYKLKESPAWKLNNDIELPIL